MGCLPAPARENDHTYKADLPFLNYVCVEENSKEINYLFLEMSVWQFFRGDTILLALSEHSSKTC